MWFHFYRNAVQAQLIADGIIGGDAQVVIAGPANTYAHYVTTIEEYGVQRYEGASTLFGPCLSPVRLWSHRH
jgi:neutral ceramidase